MKFFIITIIGAMSLFCLWAVVDDYMRSSDETYWELDDH